MSGSSKGTVAVQGHKHRTRKMIQWVNQPAQLTHYLEDSVKTKLEILKRYSLYWSTQFPHVLCIMNAPSYLYRFEENVNNLK
jgi:hypothetical protein